VSLETVGGDAWYSYATTVETTSVATESSATWGNGDGQGIQPALRATPSRQVDFQYASGL
jgi:hypothetical protein